MDYDRINKKKNIDKLRNELMIQLKKEYDKFFIKKAIRTNCYIGTTTDYIIWLENKIIDLQILNMSMTFYC